MELRDRFVEVVKANAEGRVTVDDAGGSTYHPPGSRIRQTGDWLAFVGSWGFLLPAAGARSLVLTGTSGFPSFYPGIDPRVNLAILGFVPLLVWPFVVAGVLRTRIYAKLGVATLGLVGMALTWPIIQQVLAGAPAGAGPLLGLTLGGLMVFCGGLASAAALHYGEWAKQYDV